MLKLNFSITTVVSRAELLQLSTPVRSIDRYYHGNKKYMALRGRYRARNLFAPVENIHAIRRNEKIAMRYRDKYNVRSPKFVPVHKLPAPRWKWDYDLTDDNSSAALYAHPENSEIMTDKNVAISPLTGGLELMPWKRGSLRCGAVGVKLGVHYMWLKDGSRVATTLIQILDCHVIKYFPKNEYNGVYAAAIIGTKSASPFFRNEKYTEFCRDAGVTVKEKCFRFRITENARLEPGTPIYAQHFKVGQHVHLKARSIGYGFAGVMQRFHMKGGPASHGASKWHRRIGSIAASGGRPMKGRRLPGQLGGTYETARSRKVLRINTRYNVIYVSGRIPGHVNTFVKITDALRRKICIETDEDEKKQIGPFPTFYPKLAERNVQENIFDENVFKFEDPSIVFTGKNSN